MVRPSAGKDHSTATFPDLPSGRYFNGGGLPAHPRRPDGVPALVGKDPHGLQLASVPVLFPAGRPGRLLRRPARDEEPDADPGELLLLRLDQPPVCSAACLEHPGRLFLRQPDLRLLAAVR